MAENTTPGPPLRLATSNGPHQDHGHRRPIGGLRLVVSQAQPPDALDRYFASAEQAYPQLRHWVVQIKRAVRERGLQAPPRAQ
jgi:hypothetical protein